MRLGVRRELDKFLHNQIPGTVLHQQFRHVNIYHIPRGAASEEGQPPLRVAQILAIMEQAKGMDFTIRNYNVSRMTTLKQVFSMLAER